MPTAERGDGWRDGRGGVMQDEDHIAGSSREPFFDPPQGQHRLGCQGGPNFMDGKMIKLSPRITKKQYEMMKPDAMCEFVRFDCVRFDTAQEQLKKANEEMNIWKEQAQLAEQRRGIQEHICQICIQLLM